MRECACFSLSVGCVSFKSSQAVYFFPGLGFKNGLSNRVGLYPAGVLALAVNTFGFVNIAFETFGAWLGMRTNMISCEVGLCTACLPGTPCKGNPWSTVNLTQTSRRES